MVNQKEIDTVSNLDAFQRYRYFMKRTADYEEFWVLKDVNGGLALSRVDNHILLPVWNSIEFTTSWLNNEWREYKKVNVSLDEFATSLIPFIEEKGILIDVFPVNNRAGFVVTLEEFMSDLNIELSNYE